jgi:hypothetical protein
VFTVYCLGHRSSVLLDASRIEALDNTRDGPVLSWRCWCGTRGRLWPSTGRQVCPDAA